MHTGCNTHTYDSFAEAAPSDDYSNYFPFLVLKTDTPLDMSVHCFVIEDSTQLFNLDYCTPSTYTILMLKFAYR